MKKVKIISAVLEYLSFIIVFLGCIFFIGSVGAYDAGSITFCRFLLQELGAVISIAGGIGVYAVRDRFNARFIKD